MKNILILITAIVALSSCTRSKKELTASNYREKVDSSATMTETIKIISTVDTTIYTTEVKDSASVPMKDVIGREVVVIDNDVQQVTALIDAVSGEVKVKATAKKQKVTAKGTVIRLENRKTDVRVKEKKQGDSKEVEKKKTKPSGFAFSLSILALFVIVAYLLYRYFRPRLFP